jgi:hypothetical protein
MNWESLGLKRRLSGVIRGETRHGTPCEACHKACQAKTGEAECYTPQRHASQGVPQGVQHSVAEAERCTPQQHASQGVLLGVDLSVRYSNLKKKKKKARGLANPMHNINNLLCN